MNEDIKEEVQNEEKVDNTGNIENKEKENEVVSSEATAKVEEPKEEKKEEDKDKDKEEYKKPLYREIMEWVVCLVVAFAFAICIKYFLFTPTLVKQSSMYPTISGDERVFINRLVRTFKIELKRGDIITLEAPKGIIDGDIKANYDEYTGMKWFVYEVLEIGKTSYIKRVVGLPGDHIEIKDDKVYVNGEFYDESSYLPDGTKTYIRNASSNGMPNDFVVPEGYIFAMGDNRECSRDCREFGCVPIEKVEGRAEIRIWPLDKFGEIKKSTITKDEVDEYNNRSNY